VTIGGWILMTVAWTAILGLTAWCVARILRAGRGDSESS